MAQQDERSRDWTTGAAEWVSDQPWVAIPRRTVKEFFDDEAPLHAAALAFFTLFAVAPLIVLVILLASLAWSGGEGARGQLFHTAEVLLGPQKANALQTLIANVQPPSSGLGATLLGAVVLIYAASRAFTYLEVSMNRIWDVKAKEERSLAKTAKKRFLSFGMVLAVGFLLLASVVVTSVMEGLTQTLAQVFPWDRVVFELVRLGVIFVLVALALMAMYRYLPDAQIGWNDVVVGSLVTALLFVAGQYAMGFLLTGSSLVQAFGGLATVAVILLWFYYSALILLMGAEFTQVWVRYQGHSIRPESDIAERRGKKKPLRKRGHSAG